MAVYLRITYLQAVHYYYFALGLMSFFTAMLLGFMPAYFIIFITLFALNSAVSWFMSVSIYRRVKQLIVINSLKYAIKHFVLALFLILGEISLLFLAPGYFIPVLNIFMFINFFALFAVAMLYGISRVHFVRKEFAVQDVFRIRVAKNMIIHFRHKKGIRPVFVTDQEIREYKPGTVHSLDKILASLAKSMGRGNMESRIREFEKTFLEKHLQIAEKTINHVKKGTDMPRSGEVLENLIRRSESYKSRLKTFNEYQLAKSREKARLV